jgi:hypothetical protein
VLKQTTSSERSNITGGAFGTGALAVAALLTASINHAGGLNASSGPGILLGRNSSTVIGRYLLINLCSLAFALSTRSRFLRSAAFTISVTSPSGARSSSSESTTSLRASRPIMLSLSLPTGLSVNVAFPPGSVDLVLCCLLSRFLRCLFLCASGFRCVSRDSGWPDVRIGPFTDSNSLVLRAGRLGAGTFLPLVPSHACLVVLLSLRPLSFSALSSRAEDNLGRAARRLWRQA